MGPRENWQIHTTVDFKVVTMDENPSFNLTINNIFYDCYIPQNNSQCDQLPWYLNSSPYCCETPDVTWPELWSDPVVKIFYIGLLASVAADLSRLLVCLGSLRRRSGNAFLNFVLSMAYYSLGLLVPYIIGRIKSADFKNYAFVVWAIFSILYLGSANSIWAYIVDGNEQWKKKIIEQLILLFWAFYLWLPYALDWEFSVPLLAILILSCSKLADTCQAFRQASLSTGVPSNTKLVADYM